MIGVRLVGLLAVVTEMGCGVKRLKVMEKSREGDEEAFEGS